MIFALDVGTRKVAGLIGYIDNDLLNVVDFEMIEHPVRSMLDGQIHDIKSVALVVEEVKKRLEERNELKLNEVAVAVAGRFLKTVVLEAETEFSGDVIDERTVKELEMKAISQIPLSDEGGSELHCAGYSVIEYKLDGFWMKNLIGHRGRKLYVRLVAALLPVQVVNAMIASLHRAGLRPSFLTLEPMAVLQVAIPEDLRILNIGVVDIGAGTSDIALAKGGVIVGYEMVPMAGDEITEVIAQTYLLDFLAAERVKRSIDDNVTIEVADVTGRKTTVQSSSVLKAISPTIELIANNIAEKIKQLNLGKPSALFLVGGGAKLECLRGELARALELPIERVTLKNVEDLPKIKSLREDFTGSEFVTLTGIAYASAYSSGSIYDTITLNGERIQLLKVGQNQTILRLLIQKGFKFTEILGTPQPSITFQINGKEHTISGKILGGMKAFVNGTQVPLHHVIRDGDEIVVEKNDSEEPLIPKLSDFVKKLSVEVNGEEFFELLPEVFVNNELVKDLDRQIADGDKIIIKYPEPDEIKKTVEEKTGQISYFINGEKKIAQKISLHFVKIVEDDQKKKYVFEGESTKIKHVLPKSEPITVFFNDQEIVLKPMNNLVFVNEQYLSSETELSEEMKIEYTSWQPIIADVLAKVNLNTKDLLDYKIFLNEKQVSFVEKVNPKDKIRFEGIRKAQPNQS